MSAPAPKTGKVSDDELAATVSWFNHTPRDRDLSLSLISEQNRYARYAIIRALRAGVPLEKLL